MSGSKVWAPADLLGPDLPGASCVGQAPMFDGDLLPDESLEDREARLACAVRVCGRCPVFAECRALLAELPRGAAGVGKTTLISHVLVSMLGIGGTHVLGLPVAPARKVLYLAMDRPQQIARALSRHVRAEHRTILAEHLVVWKGPPPADLAKHPGALLTLAEQAGADVVVLDSLKDAAIGLSEDEVGAGYNRARQLLLAHGVEVVELHHTRKPAAGATSTPSLSDVYWSTWITSGAGSVLMLAGDPGDPIVDMRHLKQPAGEVGPYRLLHDQESGAMSVEHSTDLLAIVRASGVEGLTAKRAAVAVFEKDTPSRAQIEKVRRKLDQLVKDGSLIREDGQLGPKGALRRPSGTRQGAVTGSHVLTQNRSSEQSRAQFPANQARTRKAVTF